MSRKRPLGTPGTMDDERPRHPDKSQNTREAVRMKYGRGAYEKNGHENNTGLRGKPRS